MGELISYSANFSPVHAQILSQIVVPSMWENSGNIPALVRLLRSIVSKGANQILAAGKLEPVLGVFQKLLSSSLTDSFAFKLLEPLIDFYSLFLFFFFFFFHSYFYLYFFVNDLFYFIYLF